MPPGGKRAKYLGFVAHEIKNPLATALWSCDLLKRMDGTDRAGERAEKMIDVSLRALRRMRRLVDDYFTLERLLEDGYELKRDRVQLQELIDAALHHLAEKDGMSVADWTVAVEGDVIGDTDMLKRGVRLAIEHVARGSGTKPPRLSIEALDRVIRISAELPPSPLVPPAAEERPTGDPLGGVLGFALAARILEAHGGRIEERDGALAVVFAA